MRYSQPCMSTHMVGCLRSLQLWGLTFCWGTHQEEGALVQQKSSCTWDCCRICQSWNWGQRTLRSPPVGSSRSPQQPSVQKSLRARWRHNEMKNSLLFCELTDYEGWDNRRQGLVVVGLLRSFAVWILWATFFLWASAIILELSLGCSRYWWVLFAAPLVPDHFVRQEILNAHIDPTCCGPHDGRVRVSRYVSTGSIPQQSAYIRRIWSFARTTITTK